VVKADGYGHGAVEVSRVLVAEGAKWLAVSSVEEGVNLRRGGILQARILVMGGFLPMRERRWWNTNSRRWFIRSTNCACWTNAGRASGQPIPYHLKIDSGMNRLGTQAGRLRSSPLFKKAATHGWRA